jgi:hypothetical protein
MDHKEKEIIRKLKVLGKRLDLIWERQRPAQDNSFEPIKAIVQKKLEHVGPLPDDERIYTRCPKCKEWFADEEILYISPNIGDATKFFHATKFNAHGQGLDSEGTPCLDVACPRCHQKLHRQYAYSANARHISPELKAARNKVRNVKTR